MNQFSKAPGPVLPVQDRPYSAQGGDRDPGRWVLDAGLEVTDLRKAFASPAGDRIEVLRGVSFSVAEGEIVAITGASGAGKSTLLQVIGALEAADHGSIRLGRFSVEGARPSALAHFRNRQVGFIFQFHHLLPDLDVAENVALPLLIARIDRHEAARRATQIIEDIGLGERVAHPVGHLSGGEQQRVAVCRALIAAPAFVLADEPTGNLDSSIGEEIGRFLVAYAHDRGAAVILATHNAKLAQLCDRVLLLRDGKISQS